MAKKEQYSSTTLRLSRNEPKTKLIPRDISESLGKLPPQALDLEEVVLGAIMLEAHALPEVIHLLKPDHFYLETHKEIYQACIELHEVGTPIDMRTVVHHLRKVGKIELVGGAHYIAELTSKLSSAANVAHHALVVVEMAIKRELIQLASEIHHRGYEDGEDGVKLLDDVAEKLDFFRKNKLPKNSESQIKAQWGDRLINKEPPEEIPLINIDGMPVAAASEHTLILGKKKSRKTLFIVWMIAQFVKATTQNASQVLIFDTEQGKNHVYKVAKKVHRITGIWVPIFTLRGMSPEERRDFIYLTIKYWRTKIRLIVIDGIRDCMMNINDPVETTETLVWLEEMIVEFKVGIIEVLHLNKSDNNARGHIGTELLNKAICTIEMEKDEKAGHTIVRCESARDQAFDTFAFTHDENELPSILGTPMRGSTMPREERAQRLENVFEGEVINFKDALERISSEFACSEFGSKKLLAEWIRNKLVIKIGRSHDPTSMYKLISNGLNGHHNGQNGQVQMDLSKKMAVEPVVEEKVAEDPDVSDLPF